MKRFLKKLLRAYQVCLSPVLHLIGGPGAGCRFEPTCSQFCLEAVDSHGAGRGLWLGFRRILRCHPWGGQGFDPVPLKTEESQHSHGPKGSSIN